MNKELLKQLCTIDGVSGREESVRTFILDQLRSYETPMDIHMDAMGNVIVHVIGKENASNKVMFDAHMDEVGFIVTHICENGFLRFATVGGIDPQVLYGSRVRINGKIGLIGGKAGHQCNPDEMKKVPGVDHLLIDIGADSAEEAKTMVKVGDTGTFDASLSYLNDDVFYGKAVDDRLGCLLLLDLAKTQPQRDIWLSFSVQEEVGLRGAGAATEAIKPDYAIAVETTTAGDIAGCDEQNATCFMGGGVVVSFADRATTYDFDLYNRIRVLADKNDIANQTKNRVVGGNNAGAIQTRGLGTRMAAVSLPCRYIHSPTCMGKISDVEAMRSLIKVLSEELTQ